jgi:hypothetical protein
VVDSVIIASSWGFWGLLARFGSGSAIGTRPRKKTKIRKKIQENVKNSWILWEPITQTNINNDALIGWRLLEKRGGAEMLLFFMV